MGWDILCSRPAALEYDTALAEKQISRGDSIPDGIVVKKFATLVWDNNDFGEETLSGHGTTHNTNGIIIRKSDVSVDANEDDTTSECIPRSR